MAHKLKKRKSNNDRHKSSFESRFGMKRSAFRELAKENPQEADAIRRKAYRAFINRPKNYGNAY